MLARRSSREFQSPYIPRSIPHPIILVKSNNRNGLRRVATVCEERMTFRCRRWGVARSSGWHLHGFLLLTRFSQFSLPAIPAQTLWVPSFLARFAPVMKSCTKDQNLPENLSLLSKLSENSADSNNSLERCCDSFRALCFAAPEHGRRAVTVESKSKKPSSAALPHGRRPLIFASIVSLVFDGRRLLSALVDPIRCSSWTTIGDRKKTNQPEPHLHRISISAASLSPSQARQAAC